MSSLAVDQLATAALQLTPEDRIELISRLAQQALPARPDMHPDWEPEIARRVAELDQGLVQPLPFDQVMSELRGVLASAEVRNR